MPALPVVLGDTATDDRQSQTHTCELQTSGARVLAFKEF